MGADSSSSLRAGLGQSLSKHTVPAPMVPCFLQLLNLSCLHFQSAASFSQFPPPSPFNSHLAVLFYILYLSRPKPLEGAQPPG